LNDDFDSPEKILLPFFEQELPDCRVLGQHNRPVEGVGGVTPFPQPLEKVSANGPIRLITRDTFGIDGIQVRQPSFGPLPFGNRGGVSGSRPERRRNADKLFVEQHDGAPLGTAAARPVCVDRLNRRFELKPAWAHVPGCFGKMPAFDQRLSEDDVDDLLKYLHQLK
jgi:hypothetical protein